MTKHAPPLAAIDIGTNSFHLIVAHVNRQTGRFKVIDREKEIVRLGTGSTDMKYMSAGAMNRAIETLRRFRRIADAAGAPIRAIATSAVREAINRDEFVRRVRMETDIRVEIASGVEEARLVYLGVLQSLPLFNKKTLLIDVGGGSTEFLIGVKRNVLVDHSLKLGAVRLTQRFFPDGVIDSKSVKRCREYIAGTMNPVSRDIRREGYEIAVGTSGTILSIASMLRAEDGENDETNLNGIILPRARLLELVERLLGTQTVKQRLKIGGLDPARADIIVAGALILEQCCKELKIKEITVSEYGLREGILLDTIEKRRRRRHIHPLDDIRYGSILHLAKTLNYEERHSHHVADLALKIFDETRELHKLGEAEREYLEAAAILHEVGLFVSHSQHHRHSYYLIRNAELLGLTENEKEIIANVARYHRKSQPKLKHEGFSSLTAEEQLLVRKLASILRIADGLDRSHSSVVEDLSCRLTPKALLLRLKRHDTAPIDMELWGAERKKDLFVGTFDLDVKLSTR